MADEFDKSLLGRQRRTRLGVARAQHENPRERHRGMDETIGSGLVPADPGRPGFDVLGARLTTRTHYINCSLAAAGRPLTPTAIGDRAREIALRCGYPVRSTTFAGTSTRAHLVALKAAAGGALAEPLGDGRWRLTPAARRRIAAASATAV